MASKQRSIGGIYASLTLRDKGFQEGIKRARLSLKEIQDGERGGLVNKDRGAGGTDWKGLTASVSAFTVGVGAAAAAVGVMNAAMVGVAETYAAYDSLNRGLKLLDGTAAATAARMEKLREIAKMPGIGFEQAIAGDIRLRSTGLSAEESEKAIRGFGNALASVGGSSASLEGVFLALGQISAKGKVSAEEINQLAERVPQIRKIMQDAFGTADTEAIQKMGIDAKQFITGVIDELEKLPRATGGAQNDLDNYTDAWKATKTQASEFGMLIAGPWIQSLSRTFSQARKDLLFFKNLFGMKTPGLDGADGMTENQRMAEQAKEQRLAIEEAAAAAENKVHNDNLQFWQDKQTERTEFLRSEAEKRAAIEEEKSKSRASAMASYNEESAILSATLSGDTVKLKALEREKAIREKIADLMQAGFTAAEAQKPAEAMVDARIKADTIQSAPSPGYRDVNAYQSRGLSLGGSISTPKKDELKTLQSIDKTLKDARKNGTLTWD
jgi:tape measure domain-containing protein